MPTFCFSQLGGMGVRLKLGKRLHVFTNPQQHLKGLLPLRNQLASLVDPSNSDLSLPMGHAFQNVPSGLYWSATTNVGNPTGAWVVVFINGNVGTISKANDVFVWCVRGGQSFDGNTHNTLH